MPKAAKTLSDVRWSRLGAKSKDQGTDF